MNERDMNKLKTNLPRLKLNAQSLCMENRMQLVLLVLTGNHHRNSQEKIFIKVHWLKINIEFAGTGTIYHTTYQIII